MRRHLISFLLAATITTVSAQNPIIRDQFTADPTARVFNGKVYLYPSHDIPAPEGQRQDWFCMADYHVFSSEDLTTWTDHGVIVTQAQVPWGKPNGYSMWAPDCVCKDGKYYFFFPDTPKAGRGFAVGVATANSPEGPFTCEPEPVKGIMGIDPCVLLDDDGQAYIYWAGGAIRGAKLQADMKAIEGEAQQMQGLPEGFKEGPYAFKRNGLYYLTFPWVRKEGGTETLAYAVSRQPLGPWEFKGLIMAEHTNRCWTNHHSIIQYRGEWLLFYHQNDYSPSFDKLRSAHIDRLTFNSDGTIQEVKPTLRGVGITPADSKIQIDRYSDAASGVSSQLIDTLNAFRGFEVTLPQRGSWVQYNDVDFSNVKDAYLVVCAQAQENTEFFVREKNAKGKILAKVTLTVKSQQGNFRRDMSGQWITLTAPLSYVPKGTTDLCITCEGKEVSIDWIQFKNRLHYFTPVAKGAAATTPDADGFIRRWRLMEPIPQEIRSNVVFTNTWLRDIFSTELAKLPKQKAKWYTFDSEFYNMKLFRFAEKYGKQAYGNLFWCETMIDCAEELSNLRLAAGSNGASMWWLNDEEVLLLEGDRRMVKDDGVSARLTLRKGHNVLRCAVINGPGMSDFCVRFIQEDGTPVTTISIND